MKSDWLVIGCGLIAIGVITLPFLLAPWMERWEKNGGPSFSGLWTEDE